MLDQVKRSFVLDNRARTDTDISRPRLIHHGALLEEDRFEIRRRPPDLGFSANEHRAAPVCCRPLVALTCRQDHEPVEGRWTHRRAAVRLAPNQAIGSRMNAQCRDDP